MSRLIDTDALIEDLKKWKGLDNKTIEAVIETINNQPTAFDTEKVVEQLEEMKNNKDCQVYCYEFYKKKCMIHKKAIDIVKKGGVK